MDKTSLTLPKKILIVDDEYSVREALMIFFAARGYNVEKADDGLVALNKLGKEDFDLIISDIRMKNMDGPALVRELKSLHKKPPVIFITANYAPDDCSKVRYGGDVSYIQKPFDMGHIEKCAADAVSGISKGQPKIINCLSGKNERLRIAAEDLAMLHELENCEGPLILKKSNVLKMINETAAQLEAVSKNKKLNIRAAVYDSIDMIYCDEKKIKRVLYHIAENAVKACVEGSVIRIEAGKFAVGGDDFIKFSVLDPGLVLSGKNSRELLRKFGKAKPTNDDSEVNNNVKEDDLGLILSRVIVEAHCGSIWLEAGNADDHRDIMLSFTLPIM